MSTITRKTTPALDALVTHLIDKTSNARLETWATVLNRARNNGKVTALKTWLSDHDMLETLQVTYKDETLTNGWLPGPREIAHYATYATFNGSRRDYAGVTCITSSHHVWVGWDASTSTLVCYSTI